MARTMVVYSTEFLSKQGRHEDAAARLRSAVAILRRSAGVDAIAWAERAEVLRGQPEPPRPDLGEPTAELVFRTGLGAVRSGAAHPTKK